jgi:hypothetical protein
MKSAAWSKVYLALWAMWCLLATGLAVAGPWSLGPVHRDLWWVLIGGFAALEGVGAIRRVDGKPMLTEVFGHYVPGAVLFPVLAIGMWRLSHWVPGWALWPGSAWQVWHFIATYHTYQKMG